MRKLLIIAAVALALVACSKNLQKNFDSAFESYNDALTSNDLRATIPFVAEKAMAEYLKSYDSAKNARIFTARVLKKTVDDTNRTARVDIELDYYMLNANKVKSLRYTQKWASIQENKNEDWKLLTPLPEFR
jgi:hypothetical protein